jgi:hypothetical protein
MKGHERKGRRNEITKYGQEKQRERHGLKKQRKGN